MSQEKSNIGLEENRYNITKLLGKGGFGEVYLAWDNQLERQVALKVIHKYAGDLKQEAKALAKLSHENIVGIYDIIQWESSPAIVMEYIDSGISFTPERLKHLTLAEFLSFYLPLLAGVEAIHEQHLIHGDIKLSNILIDHRGKVKLTDFGLAQHESCNNNHSHSQQNTFDSKENEENTVSDKIVGSWECLSPEQLRNKPLTAATDIFSLGTILFSALFGYHPFVITGDSQATRKAIETGAKFHGITPKNKELEPFIHICQQMLQINPKRRPTIKQVQALFQPYGEFVTTNALGIASEETQSLDASPDNTWVSVLKQRSTVITTLIFAGAIAATISGYFRVFEPIKSTLVIPTLAESLAHSNKVDKDGKPITPELQKILVEKEKAMTVIMDDELTDSVLADPKRRLVTKREWRGNRDWQQVAESLLVDEIVFGQTQCNEFESCRFTLSKYSRKERKVVDNVSIDTPTDNILEVSEVISSMTDNMLGGYRNENTEKRATQEELEHYLRYRANLDKLSNTELITALEGMIEKGTSFNTAYAYLGKLYLKEYEVTREHDWLLKTKTIADRISHTISGLELLFWMNIEKKQFTKAQEILDQIRQLPAIDQSYLVLRNSFLKFESGDKTKAVNYLLSQNNIRKNARYYHTLVYMLNDLARNEEVLSYTEQWLQLEPENRNAKEYQLVALIFLGDLRKALDIGLKLQTENANQLVLDNLSLIYLLQGDFDQCIKILSNLLKANPDNRNILYNLAEAYRGQKNNAKANDLFKQFVTATLKFSDLQWQDHAYLALSYAHLKQTNEALLSMQNMSAQALASGNSSDGMYYLLSSHIYSLLGQNKAALINAKEALRKGQGLHWFNLPWLAELKAQLELKAAN
ncbi:serine/threonine-protein kinase [Marinibactrum halimedae]|uniref:Protein kinase domain-containing protein n=1 Tax=Marinibactrum halimedae TaxID=1444977 RepID=A0AA37T1X1_9GAMM|nr:serine/threonine-protein kinase [Marinibactrum halimedae]MCD9458732.1 protein kinase [Marinibactrum halimedae]GLS25289.1 hypothetical protein GCM10007877_10030 [Marinibactrum halimedae]